MEYPRRNALSVRPRNQRFRWVAKNSWLAAPTWDADEQTATVSNAVAAVTGHLHFVCHAQA